MIHNVYCSYEHVYIFYLYCICIFIAIFFQLQLTGIADCESWKVFIKTDLSSRFIWKNTTWNIELPQNTTTLKFNSI